MTSPMEALYEARLMLSGLESIAGTTVAQAILIERLGQCLDRIQEQLKESDK